MSVYTEADGQKGVCPPPVLIVPRFRSLLHLSAVTPAGHNTKILGPEILQLKCYDANRLKVHFMYVSMIGPVDQSKYMRIVR